MPSSPYNFATLAASSPVKLLGANILEVPPASGWSAGSSPWVWAFSNWSSAYPNWYLPQIKRWKRAGANCLRLILGHEGVLTGAYTQAAYETMIAQLLGDIRANGLTIGFAAYGTGGFSTIAGGPYTNAQLYAPTQSLITNVLSANQDIIAYVEPGEQEGNLYSTDITTNIALCALMKAQTSIPTCCSITLYPGDISKAVSASVDVIGFHWYPQGGGPSGIDRNNQSAYLTSGLVNSSGKPILIEENMYYGSGVYNTKGDYMQGALEAAFGHPSVVGVLFWAGFGPTFDQDWTCFNTSGISYSTSSDAPDTWASFVFARWGTQNRNQVTTLVNNGTLVVNSTPTAVPTNCLTNTQSNSVLTGGANNSTQTFVTCPTSWVGTISVTSDPSVTYRVSYDVYEQNLGVWETIAFQNFTGSITNQAINLAGTLPIGRWQQFQLRVSIVTGSATTTVTAMNCQNTYGVAPAPAGPVSTKAFGLV